LHYTVFFMLSAHLSWQLHNR